MLVNVMNLSQSTQLTASHAVEYLINEENGLLTFEDLQDIARKGCAACAPNGLTYYHETWDFFIKFEDDVEDYFYNKYGDAWLERFAKNSTSVRGMVNHMVWTFVNQVAQEVTGIK